MADNNKDDEHEMISYESSTQGTKLIPKKVSWFTRNVTEPMLNGYDQASVEAARKEADKRDGK